MATKASYKISDNTGRTVTRELDPNNQGGKTLVYFVGSSPLAVGVTQITIPPLSPGNWDYSIGNIEVDNDSSASLALAKNPTLLGTTKSLDAASTMLSLSTVA